MCDSLGQTITNFLHNPCGNSTEKAETALWYAICSAIEGQKTARFRHNVFHFRYDKDFDDRLRPLPDTVELFGVEKDFSEALVQLYSKLFEIIKSFDLNKIRPLIGDETSKITFIRYWLGVTLNNKVFRDENNAYRRKRRNVERKIRDIFQDKSLVDIRALDEVLKNSFSSNIYTTLVNDFEKHHIACWAMYYASMPIEKIGAWLRDILHKDICANDICANRKRVDRKLMPFLIPEYSLDDISVPIVKPGCDQESQYYRNSFEIDVVSEFSRDELLGQTCIPDVINWQEHAFFWRPGEKDYLGKPLEGDKANRAMYIAFFYTWLRYCSYVTFEEIGLETGVNTSTVTRWSQSPHDILKMPFPFKFFFDESGYYPVYFSEISRNCIGMNVPQIRCYRGNDYQGATYARIWEIKKILWSIYDLLRNRNDRLDYIETCYDENAGQVFQDKSFCFFYEIRANDDVEKFHKKQPYPVLYIKSVEMNDAEMSD